eukprot:3720414-Amphidinium_carterae.1
MLGSKHGVAWVGSNPTKVERKLLKRIRHYAQEVSDSTYLRRHHMIDSGSALLPTWLYGDCSSCALGESEHTSCIMSTIAAFAAPVPLARFQDAGAKMELLN